MSASDGNGAYRQKGQFGAFGSVLSALRTTQSKFVRTARNQPLTILVDWDDDDSSIPMQTDSNDELLDDMEEQLALML